MENSTYYFGDVEYDENGYVKSFKLLRPATTAFMRICTNLITIGDNPAIAIDEEISYEYKYGGQLNPTIKVDYSQIINSPQKNCWSILPYERLNICYSSINRKPINTVEHFTDAATNFGYNALKCDVRPTSDGELVCCHDAGFTFNSSGKITTYDSSNQTKIHDVTAATCLGYSFPTGEHPCLVGDYLDVCREHGKVAFVTIRNEYMDVVIPKLLEELKIHNMTYSTIINSMTYESLVQWRAQDQAVMINYTLNYGVAIDQTQIDRAIGLGYCTLSGFSLSSSSTDPSASCDFEYARANGIRLLEAIAYKEGSPEACYAMGYDGCTIGIPWNPKSSTGGSVDAYTKAEIDAIMGSYITDINNLVGGGS
jgi:glycerophosphoryl diester phosphodiesterase